MPNIIYVKTEKNVGGVAIWLPFKLRSVGIWLCTNNLSCFVLQSKLTFVRSQYCGIDTKRDIDLANAFTLGFKK